jgi:hypothetical protein
MACLTAFSRQRIHSLRCWGTFKAKASRAHSLPGPGSRSAASGTAAICIVSPLERGNRRAGAWRGDDKQAPATQPATNQPPEVKER